MSITVSVTDEIIASALASGFKDFEDAIQYYCALTVSKPDAIITRNTKDFRKSSVAVLTPQEAINGLPDELPF